MNKVEQHKVVGLLHLLDIPNNKLENISMNFIISLPQTQQGRSQLTKLARFIPNKIAITSRELVYKFVDCWPKV